MGLGIRIPTTGHSLGKSLHPLCTRFLFCEMGAQQRALHPVAVKKQSPPEKTEQNIDLL